MIYMCNFYEHANEYSHDIIYREHYCVFSADSMPAHLDEHLTEDKIQNPPHKHPTPYSLHPLLA